MTLNQVRQMVFKGRHLRATAESLTQADAAIRSAPAGQFADGERDYLIQALSAAFHQQINRTEEHQP